MFKKMISNNQGHCPHCDSDDLNYGAVQFEGEMCYFPFKCYQCGQEGEEWYSMDFIGHNAISEEGDNEEVETLLSSQEKGDEE